MDRNERQRRSFAWAAAAFGPAHPGGAADALHPRERARRFLEEALELVQSTDLPREQALKLLELVYSRPAGDPQKEIGQVGVTLISLAESLGLSAEEEEQREYDRCLGLPLEHFTARAQWKRELGVLGEYEEKGS